MQTVPIGKVAGAYADAMKMGNDGPGATAFAAPLVEPRAVTGETFVEFMQTQAQEAVATVQKSEDVSTAAMKGKASVQEVVESVMAAEMTVQSVVTIRDRVVAAYQEIMRMPI